MAVIFVACSGPQSLTQHEDEAGDQSYLELDVEPSSATIYLDGTYQGTVDGWHQQVMPIEAGDHRLKLSAPGFYAQRFDLDVTPGRWLTLRVRLEPAIDTAEPDDSQPNASTPVDSPHHPQAPDSQ